MRSLVNALVLLILMAGPVLSGERAKVPSQDALDKARKEIKDIYQPEFAKATTAQLKSELAKALIGKATETPEPASHYMLLTIAQAIAVQGNNIGLAGQAIDQLNENFQVDAPALRKSAIESISAATKMGLKDRAALIAAAHRLAIEAVRGDDYETAAWAADVAVTQAKKQRERSAAAKYEELQKSIQMLAARAKDLDSARKTLAKQADSKSANEMLGRFYCFYKNDWDKGLPMLALGDNTSLKDLAVKELKNSDTAADQVALADAWWEVASQEKDALSQQTIKQRAIHWYEAANPALTGLSKDKAKRRIAEKKELALALTSEPAEPAAAEDESKSTTTRPGHAVKMVDMIALVNTALDGKPPDKWRVIDNTLQCVEGNFIPKLVFPYEPPLEYDLKFVFMQPRLRNGLGTLMPNPKRKVTFAWGIGGGRGSLGGFSSGDDGSMPVQGEPIIQAGRRYTVVLKIRANEVAALVEGRMVEQHKTEFAELFVGHWRKIDEDRQLGVYCDDPVVFYEIKVGEVRGPGRILRKK